MKDYRRLSSPSVGFAQDSYEQAVVAEPAAARDEGRYDLEIGLTKRPRSMPSRPGGQDGRSDSSWIHDEKKG
jgi:hypothetical protein